MARKDYRKEKVNFFSNTLFPPSLPEVFKRIHYYLYTNSNIPRAERLGAEMTRILFCKIYDELHNQEYSSSRGNYTSITNLFSMW